MTQGWSLKDDIGRNLFNITVEVISVMGNETYPDYTLQIKDCDANDF